MAHVRKPKASWHNLSSGKCTARGHLKGSSMRIAVQQARSICKRSWRSRFRLLQKVLYIYLALLCLFASWLSSPSDLTVVRMLGPETSNLDYLDWPKVMMCMGPLGTFQFIGKLLLRRSAQGAGAAGAGREGDDGERGSWACAFPNGPPKHKDPRFWLKGPEAKGIPRVSPKQSSTACGVEPNTGFNSPYY